MLHKKKKTMIKPIPQHLSLLDESETTHSSSPASQGENFRPIDHQRNDSGTNSPSEMFIPRPPPLFPPFFPSPFMPHLPSNPFIMHPRFPMPNPGPFFIPDGSDANSSEILDLSNSMNYDAQLNEASVADDEKPKKPKKSIKKKKKNIRRSLITVLILLFFYHSL